MLNVSLTGAWTGVAPDGTEISYTFFKDGKVVWRMKEKAFQRKFPTGVTGKYQLRPGKPYWLLDIEDYKEPQFKEVRFQAIAEFEDRQTMKLEGRASTDGERPSEFSNEAIVFRASKK